LLAHGLRFSPSTPASSTTKTGRHDIAESGVKHNKSNQINQMSERASIFRAIYVRTYYIQVNRKATNKTQAISA
jgi:hypothetical protein